MKCLSVECEVLGCLSLPHHLQWEMQTRWYGEGMWSARGLTTDELPIGKGIAYNNPYVKTEVQACVRTLPVGCGTDSKSMVNASAFCIAGK